MLNCTRLALRTMLRASGFALALLLTTPNFVSADEPISERPRLLVVVSVDQFCQDYLIRFQENFPTAPGESFFKTILQHGAWYPQCHHRQAFTFTAPGHSVMLTGAYPCSTGVIENDWFDRRTGKYRYCVSDPTVEVIGLAAGKPMSPRVLLVDNVGDRLKLATEGQGKIIGISIKDRAAILMSGHRADAAYWMEKNQWVTSSYYRRDLPGYLRTLNEYMAIDQFRGKTWDLLLPREKYRNQGPDDNEFENPPVGFQAYFPHVLAKLGELTPDKFGDQVLYSPFGNDYTLQAAREIIEQEQLGADDIPDLLTVNFASNDYVGHAFGPQSLEVEDITYRTDRQLAAFIKYLDAQVGKGRWTLALTADHGVAPIPELGITGARGEQALLGKRNPLGDLKLVRNFLDALLHQELEISEQAPEASNVPVILDLDANQVYLNHDHPQLRGPKLIVAQQLIRDWLLAQPYVAAAATREELLAGGNARLLQQLRLSFNPSRSGDVLFVYTPYSILGTTALHAKPKGTNHGSPWHYDSHVPMLLLGKGIAPGRHDQPVSPAQLAPTAALLLGVDAPGGCVEKPLPQALLPVKGF